MNPQNQSRGRYLSKLSVTLLRKKTINGRNMQLLLPLNSRQNFKTGMGESMAKHATEIKEESMSSPETVVDPEIAAIGIVYAGL